MSVFAMCMFEREIPRRAGRRADVILMAQYATLLQKDERMHEL